MDSLRGCRGVMLGLVLSLCMWALFACAVYLVWWR